MDKQSERSFLIAPAFKIFERNSLVAPALILAAAMVVVAWISRDSERYRLMPREDSAVRVIDTRSGDVYTWTNRTRKGKWVWTRVGPGRGIIEDK